MAGISDDDLADILGQGDDEEEEQPQASPAPPTVPSAPLPIGVQPSQGAAPASPYSIQNPAVQDYMKNLLGDKYSDASRQQIVDQNAKDASGPNILAAIAGLGAGLQGRDTGAASQAFLGQQKAQRDAKLQAFDAGKQGILSNAKAGNDLYDAAQNQEQQAKERDPNSAESQAAQAAAKKMGINPDVADNITAAQFKSQGPIFEKMYQVEQNNQTRRDTLNANAQNRRDSAIARAQDHATASQDKALTSTQQVLESARGNPAVAQAEKDIYSSQKANSLMNMYGDPNKLSMPQVRLLSSEIAKIASGGVPGMHELEGLQPSTLTGKMSEIASRLTNSPTPAHAAEFVKQYKDYADGLTKDAQKVISDKYGRVIESRKNQLGEGNYNTLKDNYVNRFAAQEPAAANSGPVMGSSDAVRMKDPKGNIRLIPKSQVKAAIAAGGSLADSQMADAGSP